MWNCNWNILFLEPREGSLRMGTEVHSIVCRRNWEMDRRFLQVETHGIRQRNAWETFVSRYTWYKISFAHSELNNMAE